MAGTRHTSEATSFLFYEKASKTMLNDYFCSDIVSAWTLSTWRGRSGGTPPLAESLDRPRMKSLKEEEAGDLPFTTARLSRLGFDPNLSRIFEHDLRRKERS